MMILIKVLDLVFLFQWDGTRCKGWYQEEDYIKDVQKSAKAADESAHVHEEAVNQQSKPIDEEFVYFSWNWL